MASHFSSDFLGPKLSLALVAPSSLTFPSIFHICIPTKYTYFNGNPKNLFPLAKFVVLNLAPVLLLLWTTFSDLRLCLSSSILVGKYPTKLLYLLKNLPGRAQNMLSTGDHLVKSLSSDEVDVSSVQMIPDNPFPKVVLASIPAYVGETPPLFDSPLHPVPAPGHTYWLLLAMLLMRINVYLPQMSPTLSLRQLFEKPFQWYIFWCPGGLFPREENQA
ncbi:hypothetical protein DSO57_1002545 [Entomophthora muscae]|uniref:Uncharacterized protein n=1 Tax=Entomophthora muscae TaxID=34485 RepID=A0ACC2T8W8_9FUNG|nr:hypothetical protein DSO57_1002545 [Entomophthora muscae]